MSLKHSPKRNKEAIQLFFRSYVTVQSSVYCNVFFWVGFSCVFADYNTGCVNILLLGYTALVNNNFC